MTPDCPHAVPSLDDPAGWYCTADCGGNCRKGASYNATAENADLAGVTAIDQGQLHDGDRQPRPEQLAHGFKPGQVTWLPMTYYGVTGWHRFEVVGDVATTRTQVGGVEVVDTVVVNDWFAAQARPAPPKPAPGSTIDYLGTQMVVYHSGTTDDSIWLMPPGGTTALVYQWPPATAALEGPGESVSDSASPRSFSDSPIESSAIAPFSDSSFDSVSDSARFRTVGKIWQECGPYPSKGHTYYRYRWGKGDRIEGVRHIPGGALTRLVVANRAYWVHQAVHVEGRSHAEILAMIDGWRAGKKHAH